MTNGSKTNYGEARVIDALLGGQPLVIPGTWYLAVSLSAYTDAADGSALNEPVGNSYARTAVTNDLANWPAVASTQPTLKENGLDLQTPQASGGDWGPIASAYLCDDPVAGNAWLGGDLLDSAGNPTTVYVADGGSLGWAAGNFLVEED